ncbi:MAG: FAD-dependent oxidoreductase [Thermoleophilia bacterium]
MGRARRRAAAQRPDRRVDPARGRARDGRGREHRFDALVLATGARARRLGGDLPTRGVHHLRTVDDALALAAELVPGRRLAVVGAGFVGTEVASTAASLGVHVTLLDPLEAPLAGPLGLEVGRLLALRHRAQGVELRLGVRVDRLEAGPDGRVARVVLADGSDVPCDAVLVAIGSRPEPGPLAGLAALDPAGAVLADAQGRTDVPGVLACGDCASWARPDGTRQRTEHWTSAARQGRTVASTLLGEGEPLDEVPYVWSDQAGVRLQLVGRPAWAARVELEGDESAFRALYLDGDAQPRAVLLANRPREVAAWRRALAGPGVAVAA